MERGFRWRKIADEVRCAKKTVEKALVLDSWFRKHIARVRPGYLPIDAVDTLVYALGRQVQCDLTFAAGGLPDADGV